jgi:hypothetical protein
LFRLQHSSVSGFPRRGLIAACHALRPTPPSSNRTCGFPASGSPESSRLRLAQVPFLLGLLAQLRPHSGAGLSRYRVITQAVLLSSCLKHSSSKAPSLHGHYPASSLLWAHPIPGRVSSTGPPRFLGCSFDARHPLPPRRARRLLFLNSSPSVLASSHLTDWPLLF